MRCQGPSHAPNKVAVLHNSQKPGANAGEQIQRLHSGERRCGAANQKRQADKTADCQLGTAIRSLLIKDSVHPEKITDCGVLVTEKAFSRGLRSRSM